MKTATAIRGTVMVNGLLSRFHYNYSTQVWSKSDFMARTEVLSLTNNEEYTPTNDYNPATKKYVDDAINTNSIVRPYEVFRVEETIFGKTGYIDVEIMEPSVKYGLAEEYLDCSSFAFVVPTVTTPYAIVCIASSFQVSDLMVTEKWEGDPSEGEEGLYIIVQGLNVDYKINIRHKESKDGITIETIRNTRYLGISNTKEFIPTGDYNPATKKYVDENKGLNHITGTEENPIVLTDLDIGTYEIDGKLKTYPDSTSLKTVYNGLIVVERKDASISKGIYSYNGLIYSFTYTVSANVFIENKFVKDEEVLTRTNTLDFVPTGDYHPVTKKYVDDAMSSTCNIKEFTGTITGSSTLQVDVSTLEARKWYKMPEQVDGIYVTKVWFVKNGGAYSFDNDALERAELYYVFSNSDTATNIIKHGVTMLRLHINWATSTRTIYVLNNTSEFEPTEDYNFVSKKYVDDAIANASLGNGSDVSDSGVIEDSEFDDLISGTFGPEYVNRDE